MGLLDWLRQNTTLREPDDFPRVSDHPYAAEHHLLTEAILEYRSTERGWMIELDTLETGRRILALDPEAGRRMALAALERSVWRMRRERARSIRTIDERSFSNMIPDEVFKALLRRRLPFSAAELVDIIDAARAMSPSYYVTQLPLRSILAQVERLGTGAAVGESLRGALVSLRTYIRASEIQTSAHSAIAARISALLSDETVPIFEPNEAWVDALVRQTTALPVPERTSWLTLFTHLLDASAARPTAKWLAEARARRAAVGDAVVRERARAWLHAAMTNVAEPVLPRNGDFLRGTIWLLADDATTEAQALALSRLLGDLGLAMARKLPNVGMRSAKTLNAAIVALGGLPGLEPLAQLTRLRAKVKAPPAQKLIAKTLDAAARARALPVGDLEEMVTPTFGMTEPGLLRETLGDATAELRITGTDTVALTWRTAGGKPQKSVPTEVKRDHAEALAEMKRTAAEMAKMLPVQRDRLEGLFLAEREVDYAAWRERYLDHPLVGPLARRLIWRFAEAERVTLGARLDDGSLVDADDRPIAAPTAATRVGLWHPITSQVETVRAWRGWLERHEISQPFKQAHREIYLLTDAERATDTYSNRFAAHIVRQHQLAALCRARGWRYQLQGAFDNANVPTLDLPRWGLSAEFWIEPAVGTDAALSEMGIALYATTDQVRFLRGEGAVPLEQVPPLLFTEVMRDVDLFVGVSSVGNDPSWIDQAQRPAWTGYWRDFAFGDLSATAVTRREVLARLLPRLRIAPRCRLDGRFLVVRGDLRTYKIHLGSGNILMEPNDQYLCIVPARGAAARAGGSDVWLPFEGDGTMSVILSKAFLLAADGKIEDPTILRQIR